MSINIADREEIMKELDAEAPEGEVKEPEQPATPATEIQPAESDAKPPDKPGEVKPPADDELTRLKADLETANKRLKDTQQWGHNLSQRLSTLETKPKEPEAPKKPELSEDAQAYTQAPGFMEAVRHYANQTIEPINMRSQQLQTTLVGILGNMIEGEILKIHPDAKEVTKTEDWNQWVSSQPQFVQQTIRTSYDPKDTIAVLNQFKEHKQRKEFVKQQEDKTKEKSVALSAAEALPGGANFIPGARNPDEDTSDIDQLDDAQMLKRVQSRAHGAA